ncbi:MFS transporter [Peribacillus sp. SCS-37]|uniref:MFS transporter n=1 Tax=Paraperibacillus esterisolvens TaxID=3115296 RepID=UPI0039057C2E
MKRLPAVPAFLGGKFISFFGDQIYMLALPLLVYELTASPIAMGISAAAEKLPLYLYPFAGVAADRFQRKKIIIMCDAARALILGTVCILYYTHMLSFWHIAAAALASGLFSQLHNAAGFAVIPSLVKDKNKLLKVNSIDESLFNGAILLGPAAGGILISLFSPALAILVNAASFILSAWTVSRISEEQGTSGAKGNVNGKSIMLDLKEGFYFVLKSKPLLVTNAALMISTFGTTMFLTQMIIYLKIIQISDVQIGFILSAGGGGALAGAFIPMLLPERFSRKRILVITQILGGLSIICLGFCSSWLLVGTANLAGVAAASVINPIIRTIRQNSAPTELLGRVQAISRFMGWLLIPAAALLSGYAASFFNPGSLIVLAGVISLSAAAVYFLPYFKQVEL